MSELKSPEEIAWELRKKMGEDGRIGLDPDLFDQLVAEAIAAERKQLTGGTHSCSVHCERPLCVAQRRIEELEAERARVVEIPYVEMTPEEAANAGKAIKQFFTSVERQDGVWLSRAAMEQVLTAARIGREQTAEYHVYKGEEMDNDNVEALMLLDYSIEILGEALKRRGGG